MKVSTTQVEIVIVDREDKTQTHGDETHLHRDDADYADFDNDVKDVVLVSDDDIEDELHLLQDVL
jgi:hypothetical protein